MENYIHIWHSHIKLDIYTHKIRNLFNNIINLTKILFKIQLVQHSKLGLFDGENLYNLYSQSCMSCNLYKLLVQVATYTGFLYKLQLVQNLNLYITYIKVWYKNTSI